jgi:hypothetical protein
MGPDYYFRDRAARPEGRTSATNASGSSGLGFDCILEWSEPYEQEMILFSSVTSSEDCG